MTDDELDDVVHQFVAMFIAAGEYSADRETQWASALVLGPGGTMEPLSIQSVSGELVVKVATWRLRYERRHMGDLKNALNHALDVNSWYEHRHACSWIKGLFGKNKELS